MTSKADKLPLETEPVARDNNTILTLKRGDQTLSRLTQLIIVVYGAVSNFHPLCFGWELQLRVNFWQAPFSKEALFENGAKSHNFTNLFFVMSHFGTLYRSITVSSGIGFSKTAHSNCYKLDLAVVMSLACTFTCPLHFLTKPHLSFV